MELQNGTNGTFGESLDGSIPKEWSLALQDPKLIKQVENCIVGALMKFRYPFQDKLILEDAIQTLLIKIGCSFSSYSKDYSLTTWIYTIVKHWVIDEYRKTTHNTESYIDFSIGIDDDDTSFNLDASAAHAARKSGAVEQPDVDKNILYAALDKELLLLGDIYRDLVILRFKEQLEYEEIAETLNIPLGTVKARLFRAKDLLAQSIIAKRFFNELGFTLEKRKAHIEQPFKGVRVAHVNDYNASMREQKELWNELQYEETREDALKTTHVVPKDWQPDWMKDSFIKPKTKPKTIFQKPVTLVPVKSSEDAPSMIVPVVTETPTTQVTPVLFADVSEQVFIALVAALLDETFRENNLIAHHVQQISSPMTQQQYLIPIDILELAQKMCTHLKNKAA